MRITEDNLTGYEGRRVVVSEGRSPLTFADFYSLLQTDSQFRKGLSSHLSNLPYGAIHWETPPVTKAALDAPFEFVVIDSPSLARVRPDPMPFSEHFYDRDTVVDFSNLGGDAYLVAPTPPSEGSDYSHLLAFLRTAPAAVIDKLWERVGMIFHSIVADSPVWVSTAGGGVHWLHVRFDRRPKYYRYRSYCTMG